MGISASQARLLTITARLTSNEYESQQVSNAKMRLATQSQAASEDYIAALNTTQMMFTTYDAQGDAVNTNISANVLYQYSDMKNQYALVNTSGQMLVQSADAKNFKNSANLDEFLSCYGIEKTFKTTTMEENYKTLNSEGYQEIYKAWEQAVVSAKNETYSGNYYSYEYTYNDDGEIEETKIKTDNTYTDISSDKAYEYESSSASIEYNTLSTLYKNIIIAMNDGEDFSDAYSTYTSTEPYSGFFNNSGINTLADLNERYQTASQNMQDCNSYDDWLAAKAMKNAKETSITVDGEEKTLADAITDYYDKLNEFTREAEDQGCSTLEDTYTYNDENKAQWYTNLWYRLNGDSSNKSTQGEKGSNYEVIDSKLASSSEWIQDCLTQGVLTIELASNNLDNNVVQNQIESLSDTLNIKLKGISWDSKGYSSCSDITEQDDDKAIAKAEAEYERKTAEISAKDTKYQNKIKTLDTEHSALQTEYESVKSAMEKNISRSFKTFS
jgi:hypothetical protein